LKTHEEESIFSYEAFELCFAKRVQGLIFSENFHATIKAYVGSDRMHPKTHPCGKIKEHDKALEWTFKKPQSH